jgi:hypothetical protein
MFHLNRSWPTDRRQKSLSPRPRDAPKTALRIPQSGEKQKKQHWIWCKVVLTLLSSKHFCETRIEKTRVLGANSTFYRAKSAFFRLFRAPVNYPNSLADLPITGLFFHLTSAPSRRKFEFEANKWRN